MSLSNQNMSMLALKHSVYDTVSYRSIRFPDCSHTGGWQKHSPQCYCTNLIHQLLSGAKISCCLSVHILMRELDLKKCEATARGNINFFCYRDHY